MFARWITNSCSFDQPKSNWENTRSWRFNQSLSWSSFGLHDNTGAYMELKKANLKGWFTWLIFTSCLFRLVKLNGWTKVCERKDSNVFLTCSRNITYITCFPCGLHELICMPLTQVWYTKRVLYHFIQSLLCEIHEPFKILTEISQSSHVVFQGWELVLLVGLSTKLFVSVLTCSF